MPKELTVYDALAQVAKDAGAFIDDHMAELIESLTEAIERSAEEQGEETNANI